MNRRNFLRAATGCAVGLSPLASAVAMVPRKHGMSKFVPKYTYLAVMDIPVMDSAMIRLIEESRKDFYEGLLA